MSKGQFHTLSSDGDIVAISQPNGVIKFWDCESLSAGNLVHEFQPAEHLQARTTCVKFSQAKTTDQHNEAKDFLAIGNITGSVIIYNLRKQKIVTTLKHSNSSPITDLAWENARILITLAKDKSIVFWDAPKGKRIRELNVDAGSSLCVLGPQTYVAAGTELQLFKQEGSSINTVFRYNGQSTDIFSMVPVVMKSQEVSRYFLSVSKDSTVFYAWLSDLSQGEPQNRPVGSFIVQDVVNTVACQQLTENSAGIAVTTRKGSLKFFTNHFNGITKDKVKPMTAVADLKILRADGNHQQIPILGCYFLSSETLLVFYGTNMHIKFETFSVKPFLNRSSPIFTLKRVHPSLLKPTKTSSILKTVTPQISSSALFVLENASELPEKRKTVKRKHADMLEENDELHTAANALKTVEDQVNDLKLANAKHIGAGGQITDSSAHLLTQALTSNDDRKIYSVIDKGLDEQFVKNTVKQLNPAFALLFLKHLLELLNGRASKSHERTNICIMWIESVISHHIERLSQNSMHNDIIGKAFGHTSTMSSTFTSQTGLSSRLKAVMSKAAKSKPKRDQKPFQYNALAVYRDDSDSECEESMNIDTDEDSEDLSSVEDEISQRT